MRRLLFSLAAVCLTSISLAGLSGCYVHMAGVCDCDLDRDPCISRAPWALNCCAKGPCTGSPVAPVLGGGGVINNPIAPPPTKEGAPRLEDTNSREEENN